MIEGIGLDIVTVSRIARWLDDDKICLRFFTEREMEDVRSRGRNAPQSLAARFAAREAFVKALGSGFNGLSLKDIQVRNDPLGRPYFELGESAQKAMRKTGAVKAHLSLTHENGLAAAQVILES